MFALVRDGKGVWLQNASDITSKYRPGRMEWIVKDAAWGATDGAARTGARVAGARDGGPRDRGRSAPRGPTGWANGAVTAGTQGILWQFDMISQKPTMLFHAFVPEDCANNRVEVNGKSWAVYQAPGKSSPTVVGACSAATSVMIADAGAWDEPGGSAGESRRIVAGGVRQRAARLRSARVLVRAGSGRGDRQGAGGRVRRRHAARGGDREPGRWWIRPTRG